MPAVQGWLAQLVPTTLTFRLPIVLSASSAFWTTVSCAFQGIDAVVSFLKVRRKLPAMVLSNFTV
ncbi:MAG: hypothetical protein E6I84_15755 [Chloroflexi bacterium]|nr:MAG: hypothetical protein E6I84_15755 [Chloroflexota bacterium]